MENYLSMCVYEYIRKRIELDLYSMNCRDVHDKLSNEREARLRVICVA